VINLGKGDRVIDMTRLAKSEDEILEGEVDGANVAENGETASEVASGDTDEDTPTEDTE
jgi:hypothetical protein